MHENHNSRISDQAGAADQSLIEAAIELIACTDISALTATLEEMIANRLQIGTVSIYRVFDSEHSETVNERNIAQARLMPILSSVSEAEPLSEYPDIERATRTQQPLLKQDRHEPDLYLYPLVKRSGVSHVLQVRATTLPEQRIRQIEMLWKIWQHLFSLIERNELDGLTGLMNRTAFNNRLSQIFARNLPDMRRDADREPKALALIDIDHFKQVNDRYGHLYGDEVLVQLGQILSRSFRGNDLVFRFGGEEFVVVLRDCDIDHALTIFERFRTAVANHHYPQIGTKTVSIGITAIDSNSLPTTILDRADKALYYSKDHGRNQSSVYETLLATGQVEQVPPESQDVELF